MTAAASATPKSTRTKPLRHRAATADTKRKPGSKHIDPLLGGVDGKTQKLSTERSRAAILDKLVKLGFLKQKQSKERTYDALGKIIARIQTSVVKGEAPSLLPREMYHIYRDHFSMEEIGDLIVPRRTLARRIAKKEALSADETDRAIRVGSASLEAERVFADRGKAKTWLRTPNQALNGQRPIDLLRSQAGTQAVNELLGQIDHGMFV